VILDEKTQTQIRVYKKNITGEWRDLKWIQILFVLI
jgi:hypothetical protein